MYERAVIENKLKPEDNFRKLSSLLTNDTYRKFLIDEVIGKSTRFTIYSNFKNFLLDALDDAITSIKVVTKDASINVYYDREPLIRSDSALLLKDIFSFEDTNKAFILCSTSPNTIVSSMKPLDMIVEVVNNHNFGEYPTLDIHIPCTIPHN